MGCNPLVVPTPRERRHRSGRSDGIAPVNQITLDVTHTDIYARRARPKRIERTLIAGFADRRTEAFYNGRRVSAFSGFARTASRKLDQLDAATGLRDLARPGNRLERLKGDHRGQWSIRINNQWRICFEWPDGSSGPTNVQIVDYH